MRRADRSPIALLAPPSLPALLVRGAVRALCLALLGSPCFAQPVGSEFRVNVATFDDVTYPAVAVDALGFLVVWEAWSDSTSDIYARRFDADGAPLDENFRVNTYTSGNQMWPTAAAMPGGGFLVVWSSVRDGSGSGIYAQRFHAGGGRLGAEFRVNTTTTGYQDQCHAAAIESGVVVVWTSPHQDGDGSAVLGQRITAIGAKSGPEFRANAYTTGTQWHPAVSAIGGGGFVVVWSDPARDHGTSGIWANRFDSKGEPLGKEFRVNTYTTESQTQPAVAALDAGFVIAWKGAGAGDAAGVFGRRFDAVLGAVGAEFRVNTYTSATQELSGLGVASRPGGFAVAWARVPAEGSPEGDGSGAGVFGQAFKATGAPVGMEFRLNTHTSGSQGIPAISAGADGPYVAAWRSPLLPGFPYRAIAGQRFESGGAMPGDVNADGHCNVTDVLFLINHLFAGGPIPPGDGDPNNDTSCNVTDILYLINYLFAGGPAPV